MKYNIDQITTKIIQHPHFLKLKTIVENNGYHNREDVYSHLLKTYKIATEQINGNFITQPTAKEKYEDFINTEIDGMTKKDLMLLTAFLHDIGKILVFKENNKTEKLIVTNSDGTTMCPGHEYWGSTIVADVVKDFNFSPNIIQHLKTVIRLHDTFNEDYFKSRKSWSHEKLLNDVKSRAEQLYKEALFNIYCDCYTAKPLQNAIKKIEELFNDPELYIDRKYVIT